MPRDLEVWRSKLQHAKRVWAEKGIIGTGQPSHMRTLIEFYRSNQWRNLDNWGGLTDDQLRMVNKIFPFANQQQAAIISRNPETSYTAKTEDWELSAPVIEELHNYDIREQNHKRQFAAAFRDKQFAPFGVIRHGYTPFDEFDVLTGTGENARRRRLDLFRPANPNRPWLKRVAPWNVLFDTRCERFDMDGGMRWCAFRDVVSIAAIRDNPHQVLSNDLKESAGNVSAEWLEMTDPDLLAEQDPDATKFVELWTVYEVEERTWFQLAMDVGGEFIRKPGDWPIPWEWLPVNVFSANEQIDTPFELSLLEDLIPLQEELNQVRTMIHQGVLRTRRINVASKQAFDETTRAALADGDMAEWVYADGADVRTAIHVVQSGGLPQEALQHRAVVEDDMRESMGLSRMGRGQRINVESASEAQFVQMGQETAEGRIEDAFTEFVRDTEKLYMQGRRYIMARLGAAAEESVRIVGTKGNEKVIRYATADAESLHGEYEFDVRAGSMRPKNRAQEAQQAAVDLNLGLTVNQGGNIANIPFLLRNYFLKRGIDPSQALSPEAQQASEIAAQGAGRQAAIGEGQPSVADANVISLLTQQSTGGGG